MTPQNNQPSIPEHRNAEIENIIPRIYGNWEKQTPAEREQFIEYLQNPCVILVQRRYREPGELGNYEYRVALSLRTVFENEDMPGSGLSYEGIDFDVIGGFPLQAILKGFFYRGPDEHYDEVITYLGRLSDIQASDTPPKVKDLFRYRIKLLSGSEK